MDFRNRFPSLLRRSFLLLIAAAGLSQHSLAFDPDDLEPNNTEGTGTVVVTPFSKSELTIHDAADEDFFRITLNAGQRVIIDAIFDNEPPYDANEDLDIVLFPPNGSGGSDIDSSTTTSNERIDHVALFTGEYFLRVRGFGSATNIYDLTISVVDPSELCLPIISKFGAITVVCL